MSNNQHPDDETIHQAYRAAAQAKPGPVLDARILQAAHAALSAPVRKRARWYWLTLPLAAAAMAILVTTLVLQLRPAPNMPPSIVAQPEVVKPEATAKSARQQADLRVAPAKPAAKAQRRLETTVPTVVATRSAEAAKPFAEAEPIATLSGMTQPKATYAPSTPAAPQTDRLAEVGSLQSQVSNTDGTETAVEKQIEEIRKLKRAGKREAAKKALAALRKQFPQYQLPEDLRALIEPAAEEN